MSSPDIAPNQKVGAENIPPINAKKYDFELMNFVQLAANPATGHILQLAALQYLQTENKDYFEKLLEREFSGELDSKDFLKLKSGDSSTTKPSDLIGGPDAMLEVASLAKAKLGELEK